MNEFFRPLLRVCYVVSPEVVRPREIAEANRQVQTAQEGSGGRKHGSYNYDDAQRAAISKYTCQHGPSYT